MSNQSKQSLPIIKPKIPGNDDFIMSKIQVSKTWKLPAMRSYSSGRKRKSTSEEPRSPNESEELLLKKQRQNRDAQRAYRDRKEKKLKEMETVIDSLQDKVKYWQRLYQSKCNEMIHLENKFNKLVQDSNVPTAKEADLYSLIDNFKPLKSVSLLPSTSRITPLTSPLANISKTSVPLRPMPVLPNLSQQNKHKCSSPKKDHDRKGKATETTTPSKCGFCDNSTSCICTELTTTTTAENRSNSESASSMTNSTIPSPTVMNPADSSPRTKAPMTIAQLTCSSDPHTCTKCSGINQTCIKPTDNNSPDNNNNSNNNIPDEIDFTNYK